MGKCINNDAYHSGLAQGLPLQNGNHTVRNNLSNDKNITWDVFSPLLNKKEAILLLLHDFFFNFAAVAGEKSGITAIAIISRLAKLRRKQSLE